MLPAYLAVFSCGFVACWLILMGARRFALRVGYVDIPNSRKLHKEPVPYGGGLAVFLTLSLLCLGYFTLAHLGLLSALPAGLEWSQLARDPQALAIAAGGAAIFLIGLVDDMLDLRPRTKLLLEIIALLVVLGFGPKMSFFSPSPWLGTVGTLFWLLLITNAFNLLDNMDGLCAGVSLVCLGVHFLLLHHGGQYLIATLTLLLAGPVLAFLLRNFPPAKLYLGDAGSLLLGYCVGQLSVLSTYYREGEALVSILTPVLILAIPLYDVATVMWIRFKTGQPFFKADRNHFSHRLLNLGLSPRQVLGTITALSLALGLSAMLLSHAGRLQSLAIFLQALLVIAVILILENAGLRKKG